MEYRLRVQDVRVPPRHFCTRKRPLSRIKVYARRHGLVVLLLVTAVLPRTPIPVVEPSR